MIPDVRGERTNGGWSRGTDDEEEMAGDCRIEDEDRSRSTSQILKESSDQVSDEYQEIQME